MPGRFSYYYYTENNVNSVYSNYVNKYRKALTRGLTEFRFHFYTKMDNVTLNFDI